MFRDFITKQPDTTAGAKHKAASQPRRAFNPYHKRINATTNHIAVYSARGRFNARTTAQRDIGNLKTKPGATKREGNQGE